MAGLYGTAVGVAATVAMTDPNRPDPRLIVACALAGFPVLVLTVPLFYVFGAMAWNVVGGEVSEGGTAWQISVTYGAIFALAAFLNALLWMGVVGAIGRKVRASSAQRVARGRRG